MITFPTSGDLIECDGAAHHSDKYARYRDLIDGLCFYRVDSRHGCTRTGVLRSSLSMAFVIATAFTTDFAIFFEWVVPCGPHPVNNAVLAVVTCVDNGYVFFVRHETFYSWP